MHGAAPRELERLEQRVQRLLAAHGEWRRRAESAEARVHELEAAMQDVSAGRLDPVTMGERVQELELQNRMLRERLDRAHEIVQRMTARLQFGEEER